MNKRLWFSSRFSLSIAFCFLLLGMVGRTTLAAQFYRVQPGDTLYQIAHYHALTTEELAKTNHLTTANLIPGQDLVIPQATTQADEQLYTVKTGDSLFRIGKRFQADHNWLQSRNKLTSDQLQPGQTVRVPKPKYVWNIPDLIARHPGKAFLNGTGNTKRVALTFDDGPDTEYTTRILDTLGNLGVKATFFLKGNNIPGQEWVVTRMVREGHIVANHSYNHPNLRKYSPEGIVKEIKENEDLVERITGKKMALVRPPYGEMTEAGLDRMVAEGYAMINWSVDSQDWRASSTEQVMNNTLSQIKPGSIILMHSSSEGGHDLTPSVEATERLIYALDEMGYEIVPLTELLPVQAYK